MFRKYNLGKTFRNGFVISATLVLSCFSSLAMSMDADNDFNGQGNEILVATPNHCQPYCFIDGPYLGASAAFRINFTSLPTVYLGTEGTAYLGWSKIFYSGNYIAIEAFGGDSAKIRNYWNGARQFGVRSSWSGGLSVLPGYMITPQVLAFLRLGAVETHILSRHKNTIGGQIGLGGETYLVDNIDMRFEYDYTNYKPISGIHKPNTCLYNLGFVYKWNG